MMNFNRYTVKVRHDNGTKNLTVVSYSPEGARITAMGAEGCPRRAIQRVWKK